MNAVISGTSQLDSQVAEGWESYPGRRPSTVRGYIQRAGVWGQQNLLTEMLGGNAMPPVPGSFLSSRIFHMGGAWRW